MAAALLFVILAAHQLEATTVTAIWNPNAEPDIAGYLLSYGTQSGTYTTQIDVGNVTSYTVDLNAGRYYFVVQAYNASGQQSAYSTEVVADIAGSAPVILSLSPTSGPVGTGVTVTGSNFGTTQGTSTISFNGTTAGPTSWNAGSIVAPVPLGATTGNVLVTVGGVASNGVLFTVSVPAPSITGLSPTSGVVGTTVTISGANFGTTQGTSTVFFNGTAATPTSWSDGSIGVPVPSGATTGNVVVTVGGVASNGAAFTVNSTTGLPAPWLSQDIGSPAIGGLATYASGTFTVTGAGVDIWSASDQFQFVYQTLDGDGQIQARVGSLRNTSAWAKAGVMIREDLADNSPNAVAEVTAANGFVFQYRTVRGGLSARIKGSAGSAPEWVRVVRAGNALSGYYSADGVSWTLIGTRTIAMASHLYVGLAVTSRNASAATTATFDNVTVAPASTFGNHAPTLTQPADQTSIEGSSASVQLVGSDPDANPLTYSATGLPPALNVNPTSGVISGALTLTSAGTYRVTATVSDGSLSDSKTFTWTVNSPTSLPAPWMSQDVGSPDVVGQATETSGTFSVTGAGVDIWDTNDQFRFVYQTLNGDGQIVARVTSLQDTNPWAKAGVMIRQDLTPGAPNAVAEVTTENGMSFQSRNAQGAQSTAITGFAGGAPEWIRVLRSGDSLSGSYSADGTTWSPMGTFTIPLPTQVYVGLAVTSGNPSTATTATFDNVTFTAGSALAQSLASAVTGAPGSQTTALAARNLTAASTATVPAPAPANRLASSDYDGDKKSDIAFYRPATGTWHVLTSSSGAAGVNVVWGTATDIPVPGDYDGDGRTDLAFYRPSTGMWSILTSSSNYTAHFDVFAGGPHDIPVPADYDGDGLTDVAVYSPSTGRWLIVNSSTNDLTVSTFVFGSDSDIPAPGDYDGDGKADLAVYQPSSGVWKILKSSTDYATTDTFVLGTGGGIPVPGDYDGDGVTDIAVFQPSSGVWLARLSSTGATVTLSTLGPGAGIPVTGDYDGDGRADLAVFSGGAWEIRYSSANYGSGVSLNWGVSTDVPLPQNP